MATHHTDERPRKNEDEYFTRQDAELLKELRAKLDADRLKGERSQHFMKCPKCGADLQEVEKDQVKVDVCPDCQGMWLDAGEIDLTRKAGQAGGSRFMEDFFTLFNRGRK